MSNNINSTYPLSALLIHATKQEVTKEKMQAVFDVLGVEFSSKLASYFTLSAEKYATMISNIGSSSAPAAAAATSEKKEEAAAPEEKSESSDADLGLDF